MSRLREWRRERRLRPAAPHEGRRLRVAVAGVGGIARQHHLPALLGDPAADVVAIADPSPEARGRLPAIEGVEVVSDLEVAIARRAPDAVVVCAPTPAHAALAHAVLGNGLHLYLEKPIALTLADAASIEREAEAAGMVAAVGFNYPFNPLLRRLKSMLRDGALGEVRHLRTWFWERGNPDQMPAWKRTRVTGGGALLDLGSHEFDLARWVLDDEVETIEDASISSTEGEHDAAQVRFRMRGGVEVQSSLAIGKGPAYRWELETSRGLVRVDRWPPRISRRRGGRAHSAGEAGRGRAALVALGARALPIPRREPSFELALRAFVARSLGRDVELRSIADGRRSLELVLAAEAAAGTGS